jgi:acetyl esterase/lipase
MDSSSRSQIHQLLSNSIKDNQELLDKLKILDDKCQEIELFQHEYDYSVDHPANGFRSLTKAISMYFEKLNEAAKKNDLSHHQRDYATITDTLFKCVKLASYVREKGVGFDPAIFSEIDKAFYTELFDMEPQYMKPLMGQISFFHVKPGLEPFVRRLLFLLSAANATMWNKVKMFMSSSFAASSMARFAVCPDMEKVKAMTPTGINMMGVKMISCWDQRGTDSHRLNLESRNEWTLKVSSDSDPTRLEKESNRTVMTSSLLISPRNMDKENNKIIFYMHGGAFISVNAQMMAGLSAKTAKVCRVPILIGEYRKLPDHKYPAALQDTLDLYFLLTSGDATVERKLGFSPKEIIFMGDSAGGHLVLGLVIILNRLRKEHGVAVHMPKSISVQYPCAVPSFISVPSFAMMPIDPLLTTGLVGLVAGAFPPMHEPPIDEQWFRKRDGSVRETVSRCADRVRDPLFNLLAYTDYEDLKDIALFITASEMDPILDHSILLAKKWSGKVVLHVVPDVCHGFVAFYLYSGIKDELEVFFDQMRQAVLHDPTASNNNKI